MTLDINQIRDEFIASAKKRGCRVEEQPPARGYTFSANIYVESERVGRLLMRKTTISWKAKGAKKLQRLNSHEDARKIVNALAEPPAEERVGPDEPPAEAPASPAPRVRSARRGKRVPPVKKKPTIPKTPKPVKPSEGEKPSDSGITTPVVTPPTSPPRQATSLSRAVSMFKEGDFKKALEWAKLALAENPDSAAAKDILERAQRLIESKAAESVGEQEPRRVEETAKQPPVATDISGRKRELRAPEAIAAKPAAAPPPPATAESEAESPRRRLSPWVIVGLMAAILGIIIFKPPSGGRTTPERATEEATIDTLVDPLIALREEAARLRQVVDADIVGKPAAELVSVLTQITRLDPADTTAYSILGDMANRADSLGANALRANRFSMARSFLEEALLGLQQLQRQNPADTLLSDRIARNDRKRALLQVKRSAFANMVYVPADTFRMGSNAAGFDARPERDIELSAFWADKFEVTNQEYQTFLVARELDGPSDPRSSFKPYSWTGSAYPEGKARYPVVLVTWEDANRFANWLGKTLPTEAQWERIARGADGRHYPWGANFHTDSLACPEGTPVYSRVGVCTGDESPCGAMDCAGSVREWTNDWYDPEYYLRSSSRVRDPVGPRGGREKVVRGGSWREDGAIAGLTHRRSSLPPSRRATDLGFRLVIADSLYPEELRRSRDMSPARNSSTDPELVHPE